MAQDPIAATLNAPRKARAVAKEESSRVYKGDEESPNGAPPVFSPAWNNLLSSRLQAIESKFGAKFSTTKPFADMAGLKSNMAKPSMSWDELATPVRSQPKGAALSFIGRRVSIEGTVMSVEDQANGRTITVGDPANKSDKVAALIIDKSCQTPFAIGDHFSGQGLYLLHATKKELREDMFMFVYVPGQAAEASPGGNSATAAPAPEAEAGKGEFTDALKGWRLAGIVTDKDETVGLFLNKDGRRMYLRKGQKLEDGIKLVGMVDGQARLMVGKKQYDVYPW